MLFLSLLLVATTHTVASSTTVEVDCCVLLSRLHMFVAFETDTRAPVCDAVSCKNSRLMQLFQHETNTHLATRAEDSRIQFTVPATDDAMFADILVWAFIGRHYTANIEGDHTHFLFNPATQTMTAKTPKCEFQKPVYTILLFVSILLLIFSLVLQNLKHIEETRDAATARTAIQSRDTQNLLDFAPRRRVVGGQFYTSPPFVI